MSFASRNTPQGTSLGFQTVALPGTTDLLTNLLALPQGCNACVLQGEFNSSFGMRLDASTGQAPVDTLRNAQVYLSNRNEINQCVVVNNGGAANLVVQFFTGRVGPAYRQ